MTDDEDIARYAQGIPVLERHFGIWPEYCEAALGSLCGAYARVFGCDPPDWEAIALELDHPDLQAAIAYYRAVGPYERRTGRMVLESEVEEQPMVLEEPTFPEPIDVQQASEPAPVVVRGLKPIKGHGRIAPVVPYVPVEQVEYAVPDYSSAQYSRIEGLAECPEWTRRQFLQDLLEAAPPDQLPSTYNHVWQNKLDEAIWAIAEEARVLGCFSVDIYLPHSNPCPMAGMLVKAWMDHVRPSFLGMRLWFKFTGAVDSPQWPKRIYGR